MSDDAGPSPRSRVGRVVRRLGALVGAAIVLALTVGMVLGWTSFGKRATGARRARMEGSPEWRQDHFVNPQPLIKASASPLVGPPDRQATRRCTGSAQPCT